MRCSQKATKPQLPVKLAEAKPNGGRLSQVHYISDARQVSAWVTGHIGKNNILLPKYQGNQVSATGSNHQVFSTGVLLPLLTTAGR